MTMTFIEDLEERLINNKEDWEIVNKKLSEKTHLSPPVYVGEIMSQNEEHEQLYIIRVALKSIPYYQVKTDNWIACDNCNNNTFKDRLSDLLLQATLADNWQEELEKVWELNN